MLTPFLDVDMLLKAALVFIRVSAFLFALPFFGDSVVSPQVRVLIGVSLTCGLYHLVPVGWADDLRFEPLWIVSMMLRELFIGIVIGYLGKLLFEGLILAANLVGYQMGFGTANLVLPGSDIQVNAFTAMHRIVVLLCFLSLQLHYIFINGIVESFELIPAGGSILHAFLGQMFIDSTAAIFTTAIQLSAPILVALLFTMGALGLIARTVPQMNVFTLSFPISFFVGMSIYVSMAPFLPNWLKNYYISNCRELFNAVRALSP